jgi:hypothetical protein
MDEFILKFQRKNNGNLPTDSEILSKNKADYTLFMKQRMTDVVRICQQKAKNIKGLRVDEYVPFYGKNPPPTDLLKLMEDNEAYGYKRLDNVAFKAARKRAKAKGTDAFQIGDTWYIAVPIGHRSLTIADIAGAGIDPYEALHHKDPEKLLSMREQEIKFDKCKKMFKAYTKEEKVKTIRLFVEKNDKNPIFQEEVTTAKRLLRKLGAEYVG